MSATASMAADKGMVIVCSAGNMGDKPWKKITPPADADAVLTVESEEELRRALYMLSSDPELRVKLGRRAYEAITAHSGAIAKNIELLETLF